MIKPFNHTLHRRNTTIYKSKVNHDFQKKILWLYIYIYIYFIVQNIVGKIDKETLQIRFRIDPTFLFKKITKKVFIIG